MKVTAIDNESGNTVDIAESRSLSLSVMSNGETTLNEGAPRDRIVAIFDPTRLAWLVDDEEYGDLYIDP